MSRKRIKAREAARFMRRWRKALVRAAGSVCRWWWADRLASKGQSFWWYVPSVRVPRSLRKQAREHGWDG